MTQDVWWLVSAGRRIGPISADDLKSLLARNALAGDALLWTPAFGTDWKPLRETEFAPVPVALPTPPPLPGVGQAKLGNGIAWVLALIPLAGAIVGAALNALSAVGLVLFVLSAYLIHRDGLNAREAGYGNQLLRIRYWVVLVPVYLHKRARIIGSSAALLPALVAWALFLITLSVLLYQLWWMLRPT